MDELKNYTTVEAIVLVVLTRTGERYFSRIEKSGRVMTAYTLAGSELFGPWREDVITNIEDVLAKKGYRTKRKRVGFINHPENW